MTEALLVPCSRENLVEDASRNEWLEGVRKKLLFHSHRSMHVAIAQATGLSYHIVHKSLCGSRKPKRIRAAIKDCLEQWLADASNGKALDIEDDAARHYRAALCRFGMTVQSSRLSRVGSTVSDS